LSDIVEISLNTNIGRVPPHLKVSIADTTIFNGNLDKAITLKHETELSKRLVINIEKSGKTKKVADSKEPQEVIVEKITLNGLSLHPDKFGTFYQKDNSYSKDKTLQGSMLMLNGSWLFDVPIFRQDFISDLDQIQKIVFTDTRIACFGDSFTSGMFLENNQTWPHYLGATNYARIGYVKNRHWYAEIPGTCISSIVGRAKAYLKDYKCDNMVIVLPHPCRLQVKNKDGSIQVLMPGRTPEVEKKFKNVSRDIVMFGEGSLILAGYAGTLKNNLKEISQMTKLFVSSWVRETYESLPIINKNNFTILPFYELSDEFELASDNAHPGPEHNRIFANQIRPIIGG